MKSNPKGKKQMNFLHIFLGIILVIAFLGASGLLFVSLTGFDKRAYSTLSPDAEIHIGGKTRKIYDLAMEYQPKINICKTNPTPPLLWTWYEAVQTSNGVDLTYYQVWEDEISPDPFIHAFYRFFRSAYYGSPVRDIEFFQVSIDTSSGDLQGLLFETSPGEDYYVTISEHVVARYQKREDGLYNVVRTNRSGQELSRSGGKKVSFEGKRTEVYVQTWNHLSRLMTASDDDDNTVFLPSDLKYLTDDEYSNYKFVRKSQGDHRTQENPWTIRLGLLAYITLLPGVVYLFFRPKSKKGKTT